LASFHDQRRLGAAEHHGIAALVLHPCDDPLMIGDCFGLEDAVDQFIHDDAVDLVALGGARTHEREAARPELFRIGLAVHQPAGADQADAPEPALGRLRGDDLGNVHPGERRARRNRGQRLMNGVVRADQEIGAYLRELVGRSQHQFADAPPVAAVETFHMVGERRGMHRDLGMTVRPEQRGTFHADGLIAESCAFGGAADDTDMLRHGAILLTHRGFRNPGIGATGRPFRQLTRPGNCMRNAA
jgi:hypothetical protein